MVDAWTPIARETSAGRISNVEMNSANSTDGILRSRKVSVKPLGQKTPYRCGNATVLPSNPVADLRSHVLNFIYWECVRRSKRGESHRYGRRYVFPSSGRVNAAQVARDLEISEAALSRIIGGETSDITRTFLEKLAAWSGQTMSDLYEKLPQAQTPPAGVFGDKYP